MADNTIPDDLILPQYAFDDIKNQDLSKSLMDYSNNITKAFTALSGGVGSADQVKAAAADPSAGYLDAKVDDSSIEVSSNALQVKALGIDTAELAAGAVETAKIEDLNVTTGKLALDAVTGAQIADNTVKEEHIEFSNDAYMQGRNAANSASIDMIKVNSSDVVVIPDGTETATNAAPASDNDVSNKKYVDDQIGGIIVPGSLYIQSPTFSAGDPISLTQAVAADQVFRIIIEGVVSTAFVKPALTINSDTSGSNYKWSSSGQQNSTTFSSSSTSSDFIDLLDGTETWLDGSKFHIELTITSRGSNTQVTFRTSAFHESTDEITISYGAGFYDTAIMASIQLKDAGAAGDFAGRWYVSRLISL